MNRFNPACNFANGPLYRVLVVEGFGVRVKVIYFAGANNTAASFAAALAVFRPDSTSASALCNAVATPGLIISAGGALGISSSGPINAEYLSSPHAASAARREGITPIACV